MKYKPRLIATALTIAGTFACAGNNEVKAPKYTNPPPPIDTDETMNPPDPGEDWKKREAAGELAKDERPIDHAEFSKQLNVRGDDGTIYASADGGCHIYPPDGEMRPPGSTPPSQTVECPEPMLRVEWGHCTGAGTIATNAAGDACVCNLSGNPPPPAFRIPCPGAGEADSKLQASDSIDANPPAPQPDPGPQ